MFFCCCCAMFCCCCCCGLRALAHSLAGLCSFLAVAAAAAAGPLFLLLPRHSLTHHSLADFCGWQAVGERGGGGPVRVSKSRNV